MSVLKRFALILAFVMFFAMPAVSKNASMPIAPDAKQVDIIYIHGAHETKDSFEHSVRNVHDDMIEQFQNDPLMYSRLLDNGHKKIAEKEIIFFWADKTEPNLKVIEKALSYAQDFGSVVVKFGREMLCHTLHDAVWISRPANSNPLLNQLNELVKAEYAKGNETILYGYSAGSLLASQYMVRKMPIIELNDLQKDNSYTGKYFKNVIKTKNLQPTCLDALTESNIIFYTESGKFITNPDVPYLKKSFPELNNYTKQYCAPEGAVKGVVVFGTPLTTFDSGASKVGTDVNMLSQFMMKYLVEKDLFFVSVNYANDFIAMPLPNKVDFAEFASSPYLKDTHPNGGFMYDRSGIKNVSNVLSAHLSYWTNGKRFAKNIVKAYNEGYRYFYAKPEAGVKTESL